MRVRTIILLIMISFLFCSKGFTAEKKDNLKVQVETLVKQLNEGDFSARFNALSKFNQLVQGYPLELEMKRAIAPLCRALDDFEANIRSEAARVLGIIGDDSALPALEKLLKAEQILWEKDDPLNPKKPHDLYIGVLGPVKKAIADIEKKKTLLESLEKLSATAKAKTLINEIKNRNTFLPLILLAKIPQAAVPEIINVLEEYGENKMVQDGVTKHFDVQKNIEIISPYWKLKDEADGPYQDTREYLYKTFLPFLSKYGDRKVIPFLQKQIDSGNFVDYAKTAIDNIKRR